MLSASLNAASLSLHTQHASILAACLFIIIIVSVIVIIIIIFHC
jgi:hypothetical protein